VRLLKDNFTVRSHVPGSFIFNSLLKDFSTWFLVIVKIAFKSTGHTEIVQKQRMLVYVLKYTKFAFSN